MKAILHITAAATLAAGLSAAPARAQEGNNWSGFYAGVQGGIGRSRLSAQAEDFVFQYTNINPPGVQPLTVVPNLLAPLAGRDSESSLLYGGLLGWQFQSGDAVLGIEGDLRAGRSTVSAQQSIAVPVTLLAPASTATFSRDAKSRYEWSIRGRIGYGPGRTLFYGTAGIAGAHVRVRHEGTYTIPAGNNGGANSQPFPGQGPFLVTASETRGLIGWTGGIGLEHRLTSRIRIGIEGRYTDYGSKTFALDDAEQTNAGTPAPAPFTALSGEGAYAGPTRVSLTDAQVNLRLTFAF